MVGPGIVNAMCPIACNLVRDDQRRHLEVGFPSDVIYIIPYSLILAVWHSINSPSNVLNSVTIRYYCA